MSKKKLSIEKIKQIPKPKLREIINQVKKISQHKTVQEMFQEYGIDLGEIDLIPVAFADLDVSARTDHGVIYLNYKLLQGGDLGGIDHYLAHEITHFLQQCSGDKPTQGAKDGDYLNNPFEQEAFQNQTEYISDTRGDEVAEEYVDKVLDHHEIDDVKEREERKDDLLSLANRKYFLYVLAGRKEDLLKKYPLNGDKIEYFSSRDPSGNLKYLDWEMKILESGQALAQEIGDIVNLFHKYNSKLDKKDINQYGPNDLANLRDKLFEIDGQMKVKKEEKSVNQEAVACGNHVVYDSPNFIVRQIYNKSASVHYGMGTKWCITMKDQSYFEDYDMANVVFFFIFNKHLVKENPNYKVALVYHRNFDNSIINIERFDAQDNLMNSSELTQMLGQEQDKIFSITENIAENYPQSVLAKLNSGKATQEELIQANEFAKHNPEAAHTIYDTISSYANIPNKIISDWIDSGDNRLFILLGENQNTSPEILLTLINLSTLNDSSAKARIIANKNFPNDKRKIYLKNSDYRTISYFVDDYYSVDANDLEPEVAEIIVSHDTVDDNSNTKKLLVHDIKLNDNIINKILNNKVDASIIKTLIERFSRYLNQDQIKLMFEYLYSRNLYKVIISLIYELHTYEIPYEFLLEKTRQNKEYNKDFTGKPMNNQGFWFKLYDALIYSGAPINILKQIAEENKDVPNLLTDVQEQIQAREEKANRKEALLKLINKSAL